MEDMGGVEESRWILAHLGEEKGNRGREQEKSMGLGGRKHVERDHRVCSDVACSRLLGVVVSE